MGVLGGILLDSAYEVLLPGVQVMGQGQPALALELGCGVLCQGDPSVWLTKNRSECSGWQGKDSVPLPKTEPQS